MRKAHQDEEEGRAGAGPVRPVCGPRPRQFQSNGTVAGTAEANPTATAVGSGGEDGQPGVR